MLKNPWKKTSLRTKLWANHILPPASKQNEGCGPVNCKTEHVDFELNVHMYCNTVLYIELTCIELIRFVVES